MLTPGAVAAHAVSRRLAGRSLEASARTRIEETVRGVLHDRWPKPLITDVAQVWSSLRRAGWVARVLTDPDPRALVTNAAAILALIPGPEGERIDRRRLASDVVGNPHGLDEGTPLGGLVLALNVAIGRIAPRMRRRAAWAALNVECDDVVGGLLAVGIAPQGWVLPPEAIVTIPPRVLRRCGWPASHDRSWIFVTENPSIAAAAADLAASGIPVRILCTIGTPSTAEIGAIARLASEGWRIAARADFDPAGLRHVARILAMVPSAVPWRMRTSDYLASLATRPNHAPDANLTEVPPTFWDPELSSAMRDQGVATFEEALAVELIEDLRRSAPLL